MKPFIEFVAQLGCYSRYVNNCAKDGDADAVSFKIFDLRAEYDEAIIKRLALNGYSSAARIIDNNFENVTQECGFRKVARFFSIYSGVSPKTSAPHVQSVSAMMKTISAYQQPPPENDQECNKDLSWVYESSHVKYPSFSPIVSAGCSPVISSAQGNPEEIAKMNNL
ncbi:MAG: hypothetical protein J3Q66DRAFT_362472 [Benniella sp.]|nr:MAG: hypothetical protein J3Q66DRAFT_362472 [Benniella sp.]